MYYYCSLYPNKNIVVLCLFFDKTNIITINYWSIDPENTERNRYIDRENYRAQFILVYEKEILSTIGKLPEKQSFCKTIPGKN